MGFFICQWKQPGQDDWTLQVKQDLEDFSLPCSIDFVKTKSKYSFKKLVKTKSKDYALYKFLQRKETHSKLVNLNYTELAMQKYLKLTTMTAYEAKTVFSYRVRAANYSNNYRGSNGLSPCPVCLSTKIANQWHFSAPMSEIM